MRWMNVFEYENKFHNVKHVSHKIFQSCNATSPMAAAYTSGFDGISLRRTGHYYFLCSVAGHCQAGHKVDILVIPASLSSTTVTTTTASSPSLSRTSTAAIAPYYSYPT
ncbi:hypothetical protein Dsin_026466 [Dipteronia sinensis]|uniref:Phytocyanin domain-containing protein n=1 Tax=Dipteronia sinensis TaxID=43782 RepID=A0AAD9ZYD7_9ROSI|nr:hypothetical protein Dsin_026466 [Dipteronia sinensis]